MQTMLPWDVGSGVVSRAMKIVSWNVNGLRAVYKKGFMRWLNRCEADVVCLQEVRARRQQVESELARTKGWFTHLTEAERKGYSGVATLSRRDPGAIETQLGQPEFDREARYQRLWFGDLQVVSAYFPNGNGTPETVLNKAGKPVVRRSNNRVPYKLAFYRALFDRLEADRAAGCPILVMGDFNTAHRELDLARPKDNKNTSGFLAVEREELDRWLTSGWTDTFRHVHGDIPGAFTWWTQRGDCRARNIGWRLDLVLASHGALELLRDAFIQPAVMGSDHCPVGVTLELPSLKR